MVVGPTQVRNPNCISIGSASFAGLVSMADQQTDHAILVRNSRPHLLVYTYAVLWCTLKMHCYDINYHNITISQQICHVHVPHRKHQHLLNIPHTNCAISSHAISVASPETWNSISLYTVSQKKVPTFKLPVTLSNLNRLSTFLHYWKFATKPIWHYPPHLRLHYLWKLKIQIFCRCGKTKQTAFLIPSNFVIHPQILIFSVFKIASLSPYWLQIKQSMSLFLYLLLFVIILWHRECVTADITAVFVNNQHGIQRRGQDFDKKTFAFEGVDRKFPEKS